MSGDMSGAYSSPVTLALTNRPIDTDAVTVIRLYLYDWYDTYYYGIEFVNNNNNVIQPNIEELNLVNNVWILSSIVDRDAELVNIFASNDSFKLPLVTQSILLTGDLSGTLVPAYELQYQNNYINTSLLVSIVKREYDWCGTIYDALEFKFKIHDDEVIDIDILQYQTNFWILANSTEMDDEFTRMTEFVSLGDKLHSVEVTTSAGSSLTTPKIIGKTVVLVVFNDIVMQQGWTPTTVNTTSVITFTDIVFSGGETVIIIYK